MLNPIKWNKQGKLTLSEKIKQTMHFVSDNAE